MVKKIKNTDDIASTDDKIAELNAKLQALSQSAPAADISPELSHDNLTANAPKDETYVPDVNDVNTVVSNVPDVNGETGFELVNNNIHTQQNPLEKNALSNNDLTEIPVSYEPASQDMEALEDFEMNENFEGNNGNASDENDDSNNNSNTYDNTRYKNRDRETDSTKDSSLNKNEVSQNVEHNNDKKEVNTTATEKASASPKKGRKRILPCQIREAGIAETTFQMLSKFALPILLLFTLAICFQQLFFLRDFWFSEEVRLADVYMNALVTNNFFNLTLNGTPFGEVGPLYFLFVWAIENIAHIDMPKAFLGASTLFALLYVSVTWLFARALGFNKQISFASGLLCLSTFFLIGLSNYSRMDLFYAVCITLSLLCFYRGWKKSNGFIWLSFAFIFMTAATLINGPFAIIMPIFAGILFLSWSGKLRRINDGDGLLGFVLLLFILLGWLTYLYFSGYEEYIRAFIQSQVIQPIFPKPADIMPVWFYGIALPLIFLPWSILLFFVNWWQKITDIPQIIKSRKENTSSAWLVCIIISSLTLLSLVGDKLAVYLMPMLPALSILSAKALLNLSPKRSRFFFAFLAIFIFMIGTLFILFEFQAYVLQYLPNLWIIPKEIPTYIRVATTNTYFGLVVLGILLTLLSFGLWRFTRRSFAGGSLLVFTIGLIISVQPLSLLVAPQLDTILSPKTQGEFFAEYKEKGYTPASFAVYPDVYTYYYNIAQNKEVYPQDTIYNIKDLADLNHFLSTNPKVILAIPVKKWETLSNNKYSTKIQNQWLESQEIMLTLWEAPQLTILDTQFQNNNTDIPNDTNQNDMQNDIQNNTPNGDSTTILIAPQNDESTVSSDEEKPTQMEDNPSAPQTFPPTENADSMNMDIIDNQVSPNNNDNRNQNNNLNNENSSITPLPLDNLILDSMENILLPKANEEQNRDLNNENKNDKNTQTQEQNPEINEETNTSEIL